MIGAILGDMIGAPYEFDRSPKTKEFPLFYRGTGMPPCGGGAVARGTPGASPRPTGKPGPRATVDPACQCEAGASVLGSPHQCCGTGSR